MLLIFFLISINTQLVVRVSFIDPWESLCEGNSRQHDNRQNVFMSNSRNYNLFTRFMVFFVPLSNRAAKKTKTESMSMDDELKGIEDGRNIVIIFHFNSTQ